LGDDREDIASTLTLAERPFLHINVGLSSEDGAASLGAVYEGSPESATGNEELLKNGPNG
jgi:hypothetical protein